MLKILQAPAAVLSHQAKPVGKIDKEITRLIEEMTDTLVRTSDPEGVGIAAPQVGKSLQLFIIKQTNESPVLTFINPHLYTPLTLPDENTKEPKAKGNKQKPDGTKLEGCLSLQNIWGVVHRKESIFLSYLDRNGKYHKRKFSGFLATIIQHELDHVNGILFPKRVIEQGEKLYRSSKDEKGETIFEEIEI